MITHDEILDCLTGATNQSPYLVSRLVMPELGIPASYAAVILPDLHLISDKATKNYKGFFFPNAAADALTDVLDSLNNLSIEKYQLGDRFDLWRESSLEGRTDLDDDAYVQTLVARIQKTFPDVWAALSAGPWVPITGNHDAQLSCGYRGNDALPAPDGAKDAADWLWRGSGSITANDEPILILHGHLFDPLETWLPGWVHVLALHTKLGRIASPTVHALLQQPATSILVGQRDQVDPEDIADPLHSNRFSPFVSNFPTASLLPRVATDLDVNRLAPAPTFNVAEYPSLKTFWVRRDDQDPMALFNVALERSAYMATLCNQAAPSLCVIGHTHQPRIIVGQRFDGSRMALMDCGAWVEESSFPAVSGGPIVQMLSAHVGAIVGSDLRIYQIVLS